MNYDTLYHYRAVVISVYDGDTCRMEIDLGLGIWQENKKTKLINVNDWLLEKSYGNYV